MNNTESAFKKQNAVCWSFEPRLRNNFNIAFHLRLSYFFMKEDQPTDMSNYSLEEIRTKFSTSKDFNEIFDAFEDALEQRIQDVELYRLLFWNTILRPDEICLFGEKLAKEFPNIAYETYMWMANVFEATYSSFDNFELAVRYYRKASEQRPSEVQPYLNAADCYEPDLNIPPFEVLLPFLKKGIGFVLDKKSLLHRLSYLYQMRGDQEQADFYRTIAEELGRLQN
jgi:tetratricopeptide (TPR) repeat protein